LHKTYNKPPNLFSAPIPYYRIPNPPLLVRFAESGMVENMRAQAARWDTHGRAWVIYGIPNPMQTRQQCSVKKVMVFGPSVDYVIYIPVREFQVKKEK